LTGTGSVEVAGRTLPVLPADGEVPAGSGPVEVLIRPEGVRVEADPEGTATVVSASFLGSVTRVLLDLPDGVAVKADLASRDAADLLPGVRARVTPVPRPVLVVGKAATA
ncbi:TOBE domain-containing protein, partial [Streptomyces sp. SID4931]|nr:TOBE domain-containing protein [Streptomyces sp. SID4931]